MLKTYRHNISDLSKIDSFQLPTDTIWIDLLNPTPEEKLFVERALAIKVPSEASWLESVTRDVLSLTDYETRFI